MNIEVVVDKYFPLVLQYNYQNIKIVHINLKYVVKLMLLTLTEVLHLKYL